MSLGVLLFNVAFVMVFSLLFSFTYSTAVVVVVFSFLVFVVAIVQYCKQGTRTDYLLLGYCLLSILLIYYFIQNINGETLCRIYYIIIIIMYP